MQTLPTWLIQGFNDFELSLNGLSTSDLHLARKKSFLKLTQKGLPTRNDEAWKYFLLDKIYSKNFKVFKTSKEQKLKANLKPLLEESINLVTVNGTLINKELAVAGLRIETNNLKIRTECFTKHETAFADLNSSLVLEPIIINIDNNFDSNQIIEINHYTNKEAANTVIAPLVQINLAVNAKATIIERYIDESKDLEYFINPLTEIKLQANANLTHIKLVDQSSNSLQVGMLYADLDNNTNFQGYTLNANYGVIRNEIYALLNGIDIDCKLNGLSLGANQQLVDNYTVVDHAKPNSQSTELFKGIYADESKGNFSGTIIVREGAQKTNAIQSSKSLLLSDRATSNSRPQLKIWADDVKCTHGATVGQIDEKQLFYLRSRGIDQQAAHQMLIKAFAYEVLSNLDNLNLKSVLQEQLVI